MEQLMAILKDVQMVVSLIAGICSIVMFFLSKKQKDKCVSISNAIDQKIEILNKNLSITSNDKYNINKVETFDNRKSIK
jgi:hypothetical protein